VLASNRRGVARTALLTNNVAFRRRPETAAATRLARTTAAALLLHTHYTHHLHHLYHPHHPRLPTHHCLCPLLHFHPCRSLALSMSHHTGSPSSLVREFPSLPSIPAARLASLPSAVNRQWRQSRQSHHNKHARSPLSLALLHRVHTNSYYLPSCRPTTNSKCPTYSSLHNDPLN
jgi:hypothetical protein